jgi:steroid delta-isomerase-like uncharacterized protein
MALGGTFVAIEENRALARRILEELWNADKLALADELYAPNYVDNDPNNPGVRGPEGVKRLVTTYRTAFPDLRFAIEEQIAEGDMVVTRWVARGTHRGELMGLAPTGKEVTTPGITISRISGGQIVEDVVSYDAMGLMQQLGAIPMPGQVASMAGRANAHCRVAVYRFRAGAADEVIRRAETGMLPIFRGRPGFISYEVVKTGEDSGISISTWETERQAQDAVQVAAAWVQDNIADLVVSVQNHVGTIGVASMVASAAAAR